MNNHQRFLSNLPFNDFKSFISVNCCLLEIKEVETKGFFTRTFDMFLNEAKTIKFRIEMNMNVSSPDYCLVDFSSTLYYKNAYNSDYEDYYMICNLEKFQEIAAYLNAHIEEILQVSSANNLDLIISEDISTKIEKAGELQLLEVNKIRKQADLFKKYVDTGIENESKGNVFPEKIMAFGSEQINKFPEESNFSQVELKEINDLFTNIKDAISESLSETNAKITVSFNSNSGFASTNSEIDELLSKPSDDVLMELIDDSLDNGDYDAFMRYSELLKNKLN